MTGGTPPESASDHPARTNSSPQDLHGPEYGRVRRINVAARVMGLAIALTQAWVWRHAMNPDGMSYVDIANAVSRGESAVNGYWSPLYSWILAAVFMLTRPSLYWEFALVKVVNVVLFVTAFAAFEFFLNELLHRERAHASTGQISEVEIGRAPVAEWVWRTVGYALFLWCALVLTPVNLVTPDLCVVAIVFTVVGLLLRIQRGCAGLGTYLVFGAVVGLGYLAKAAMFPMALVFLASAWAAGRRPSRVALATVVFALVAVPWVVALSSQKGRVTFGDAGKLTYAWFVTDAAPSWQREGGPLWRVPTMHSLGGSSGSAAMLHPPRLLLDTPPVFEFARPVGGTYPIWYDPSYWYEGLRTRFVPRKQLTVFVGQAVDATKLLLSIMPGILILLALPHMRGTVFRSLYRQLPLLAPAAAAIGMYAVVLLHLRYIAPFLVVLTLGALAAVRPPESPAIGRVAFSQFTALASLFTALVVGLDVAYNSALAVGRLALEVRGHPEPHAQYDVATALAARGAGPGARVATINGAIDAYWAHLGRVRVIAEVPAEGVFTFWASADARRRAVYDAFSAAGAMAVIAQNPPQWASTREWVPLGATGYFYHPLGRNPDRP